MYLYDDVIDKCRKLQTIRSVDMKDCVSFSFLRNKPYCMNVIQLLIALKRFDLNRENGIAVL